MSVIFSLADRYKNTIMEVEGRRKHTIVRIIGTFTVVGVWSLSIGLAVVVCGFMFILLQLFQSQLPPAPQRCFAYPETCTTDTQCNKMYFYMDLSQDIDSPTYT